MRLGAAIPPRALGGGDHAGSTVANACRIIDALGFDSIWVFDAVGRGFVLPDPLMALTVAATVTERPELGTGVLQLPIRRIPELAHRILTLQLVAGDRLLLGVGPGSTEADFATFTAAPDFEQRFAIFENQLPELRRWLATGGDDDRSLDPWPVVAGGPTVLLAGWRGRWVERAASAGGWVASAAYADDDQLANGLSRFRAAGGERAIVTNVQVGKDLDAAVDRLGRLSAMGFDDAVIMDPVASEERLGAILDGVRGRPPSAVDDGRNETKEN